MREKYIVVTPATGVRVPKQSDEFTEMLPFTENELEAAYVTWRTKNERLADPMLVLAWTGLRWAEARSVTVAEVMEIPTPASLHAARPRRASERSRQGPTDQAGTARRPDPAHRPRVGEGQAARRSPTHHRPRIPLHRSSVLRSLRWEETGHGRRIHDLRHTAACLWLSRRVDVGTVQNWMGHESIATTNRYLHFLGTGADLAGLERLNEERGYAGGTREAGDAE